MPLTVPRLLRVRRLDDLVNGDALQAVGLNLSRADLPHHRQICVTAIHANVIAPA
jgi:hypothetical protein